MKKFAEVLQDQNGNKLAGVSVQVNISGGGAATLYSDQGVTPLTNPVTTSSLGYITFYVADGRYDLVISGTGVTTLTVSDIEIADITGNVSGSDSVTEVNTLSVGGGANITTSNATGTGSLVKQTSPTLITPILGVASATSLAASGAVTAASLALGGGIALATTNQTGTGNLVLATSPSITTPTVTGAVAGNPSIPITGVTTNSNAGAGIVGEFVQTKQTTPQSLSTGVVLSLGSISLTAGDWDIQANVVFSGTSTTGTLFIGAVSTVNNSISPTDNSWENAAVIPLITGTSIANGLLVVTNTYRVSLAGTTSYFLNAQSVFGSGACSAAGNIRARRVR